LAYFKLAFAQVSEGERKILIEFYEGTNGADWTNSWDLAESVDKWHGVTIVDGKVTRINLFRNNLEGNIPESIGELKNLTHLNLAFNSLTGLLPKDIVNLSNLKILKLEMNRIKGALPEAIGKLENLEEFTAFNNFLSGTIPDLEKLESLGLFENSLEGSIPSEIGGLSKLRELILANNRLGGAIPAEIGQLASLQILQIQNNNFDSFKNLEFMETKGLLAFDYDEKSLRNDFKDINTTKTRMADTKFEDDDNDN